MQMIKLLFVTQCINIACSYSVLYKGIPIDASLAIQISYRKLTVVLLDILEWLAIKEVLPTLLVGFTENMLRFFPKYKLCQSSRSRCYQTLNVEQLS